MDLMEAFNKAQELYIKLYHTEDIKPRGSMIEDEPNYELIEQKEQVRRRVEQKKTTKNGCVR